MSDANSFVVSATDVWKSGQRTVALAGDIDLVSRSDIIAVCLAGEEREVVIDLAGVTFMDCAGYAGLLFAQRHLADVGRNATTANAAGQPAWLLELIDALPMAGPRRVTITSQKRVLSDAQ